jgi:outer membrane receptor protein involved in Fe transport
MKNLFLIFSLASGIFEIANGQATVSGRILDKETLVPLPYVTIMVNTKSEGLTVAGALSDEDGRFVISGIDHGSYIVNCSFLGYQSMNIPLLVGEINDIYDLGKVELVTATEQLDEVIVTAKKEVVSAGLDKKSFDMADNFSQTGGSVLDAMRSLPGVTIDQEGKILLRGSDKVAILIDGKQSSLTGFGNQKGLDNIPTANIESIEIISNPSSKYDAAGMAGIINIIHKKERDTGFNGDIGLTAGLGQLNKRKEDLPTDLGSFSLNPKIIPSLNMNFRTTKVNIFLQSEILFQEKLPNNEFTTRYYDDGTTIYSQVPENRKQTQYILKGGLDWNIDDHNILTFSSMYDYEHHFDTAQVPFINSTNMERYRYWSWIESEGTGYMNFRTDYVHKFEEPGHELKMSLQYTRGWEDEAYYLNDSSNIRESKDTTHLIATEHTIPFLIDYVKPLRSGRVEAGTKLQIRRIPITYEIGMGEKSVIYPGLGDWSEWGENIYAGYLNYVHEKERYDIEAGLRIEETEVYYDIPEENIYYPENDSYSYFRVYPNVRLTFKINDENNISVFYNNRVDRPGEPELRIFPKFDDPELVKVGNPYLRPQFAQTFELAYKRYWNSGSVFLSGYHRIIDDHFLRIYAIDSSSQDYNLINKIYQNVGQASNTGFELLLTQSVGAVWKISGSFNWYRNSIDAFEGVLLFPYERPFSIDKTVDYTWDAKLNNLFELPNNLQLQLTFIYYAPKNIPQGKEYARSSLDLGVKKGVWKDKGQFTFSFSDIFNQFGIKQELNGAGFRALYENFYETQVVRLGMTYKF